MPQVVFFGTCQAQSLSTIHDTHIIADDEPRSAFINANLDLRPDDRSALQRAELIVNQVYSGPQRATLPRAELHAKIVDVPFVAGLFLWPYASEDHANRQYFLLTRMAPYDAEMGDAFLNRVLRGSQPVEDAVQRYLDLDIVTAAHVERRAEIIFHQQRRRDEATDIRTLDFIQSNLSELDLFLTRGHPSLPLMLHLARQVFAAMGIDAARIERLAHTLVRVPDHTNQAAIHPKVAAHFGLPNAGAPRRYAQFGGSYDFAECCRRYLRYDWNQKIVEGMQLADAGHAEQALASLSEGLTAEPHCAAALGVLGRVLHRLGHAGDSLRALQACWELDPGNPNHAIQYSGALAREAALPRAEQVLRHALARFPDLPELNLALSHVLTKARRFGAAADAAERAMCFSARVRPILPHLGRLLMNNGEVDRALAMRREVCRLTPLDASARAELVHGLMQAGRLPDALEECRVAIALAPDQVRHLALAAEILSRMECLDDAVATFQQVLAIDPTHRPAHVALAHLLARRQDFAAAIAHGRAALASQSGDVGLMLHVGAQMTRSGQAAQAIPLFVDAALLEPRRARIHLLLSRALLQQDRLDEAVYAAGQASALEPDDASLAANLRALLARRAGAQEAMASTRDSLQVA